MLFYFTEHLPGRKVEGRSNQNLVFPEWTAWPAREGRGFCQVAAWWETWERTFDVNKQGSTPAGKRTLLPRGCWDPEKHRGVKPDGCLEEPSQAE